MSKLSTSTSFLKRLRINTLLLVLWWRNLSRMQMPSWPKRSVTETWRRELMKNYRPRPTSTSPIIMTLWQKTQRLHNPCLLLIASSLTTSKVSTLNKLNKSWMNERCNLEKQKWQGRPTSRQSAFGPNSKKLFAVNRWLPTVNTNDSWEKSNLQLGPRKSSRETSLKHALKISTMRKRQHSNLNELFLTIMKASALFGS